MRQNNYLPFLKTSFRTLTEDTCVALTTPQPSLAISPITEHAAFVYQHIYRHPYPLNGGEPREIHGIAHVARVAFYIPVFANLYRMYGYDAAQTLTNEDIKLLQIAALFHDSARKNEGVDLWDEDSATLLYVYLTQTLEVNISKATEIAEATANKDNDRKKYRKLIVTDENKIEWQDTAVPQAKSIYAQLIQNADCLDIIRARSTFDAHYLDFYKKIACNHPEAFKVMVMLIIEARSLIEDHGDSHARLSEERKKKYDNAVAYTTLYTEVLMANNKPILSQCCGEIKTLTVRDILKETVSYQSAAGLSDQNLAAALREGLIFLRGIVTPSGLHNKHAETSANLEVRKLFRTPGIATRTQKKNKAEKFGNPARSLSMAGFGCIPYTRAGFIRVYPTLDEIEKVCGADSGTGHGKKVTHTKNTEVLADLERLHFQQQMGGVPHSGNFFSHSEILFSLNCVDGIYYSTDSRVFDAEINRAIHPDIALLEAVFLRNAYQHQYNETKKSFLERWPDNGEEQFIARFGDRPQLTIFEYSGAHNFIRTVSEERLTDDKIVEIWVALAEKILHENSALLDLSIHALKIQCTFLYLQDHSKKLSGVYSLDSNYPTELQERITHALIEKRQQFINQEATILVNKLEMASSLENFSLLILSEEDIKVLLRHIDHPVVQKYKQEIGGAIVAKLNVMTTFNNHDMWRVRRLGEAKDRKGSLMESFQPSILMYFELFLMLTQQLAITDVSEQVQKKTSAMIAQEIKNNQDFSDLTKDIVFFIATIMRYFDKNLDIFANLITEVINSSHSENPGNVYSGVYSLCEYMQTSPLLKKLCDNPIIQKKWSSYQSELKKCTVFSNLENYSNFLLFHKQINVCLPPIEEILKQILNLKPFLMFYDRYSNVPGIIKILLLLNEQDQACIVDQLIEDAVTKSLTFNTSCLLEFFTPLSDFISENGRKLLQSRVTPGAITISMSNGYELLNSLTLLKLDGLPEFLESLYDKIERDRKETKVRFLEEKKIVALKKLAIFLEYDLPKNLLNKNVLSSLKEIIQSCERENISKSTIDKNTTLDGKGFSMGKLRATPNAPQHLPNRAAFFTTSPDEIKNEAAENSNKPQSV